MMKPASSALQTLLATGGPFYLADLWTITLASGSVLYWCGGDTSIVYNTNTYVAAPDNNTQPTITRGGIRLARGLEVDNLELTLYCGDNAQIGGLDAQQAVMNGVLDNATIRLDLAVMSTYGDVSAGVIPMFSGNVSDVTPSSTQIKVTVKSDLERLNLPLPVALFSPVCANQFGDANCGYNVAGTQVSGAVTSALTATTMAFSTNLTQSDVWWTFGTITFTSGQNAGATRTVKMNYNVNGQIQLSVPLDSVPAAGDTFTIRRGCSRLVGGCRGFSNTDHFRGTPYVPQPETVR